MTQGPNPSLAVQDDDNDDVRWALQVALAQLNQGQHAEAISWVKRAAKAATQAGAARRAQELDEQARHMAQAMWNFGSIPPPPQRSAMPTSVEIDIESDVSPAKPPPLPGPGRPPPLPKRKLAPPPGAKPRPSGAPPPLPTRAPTRKSLPPGKRPSALLIQSSVPPAPAAPTFQVPTPERKSLTEVKGRAPMASAPELEVNEMSADDLKAVGIDLDSVPPEASFAPGAPPLPASFLAGARSGDSDDASLDSLQLDSVPPSEGGPAPDSVKRALALISEEEILDEDEDERVTQDLGFIHGSQPPGSVRALNEPLPSEPPPSAAPRAGRTSDLGELTLEVSDFGPPSDLQVPGPAGTPSDTSAVGPNVVDGIALDQVRGFEDLPEEVQLQLAKIVRVEPLDAGEEVAFFGAVVVTAGTVDILPAFSDESGAVAHQADVVFTKGTLAEGIALRVVSKVDGTRVAIWEPDTFDAAIAECPWVHDELRFIADYFLAVCGAALGPLGERLDDALRGAVFKRLEVRALQPGEVLLNAAEPIPSLFVLGGGQLEAMGDAAPVEEFGVGDFVYSSQMISAQKAPHQVVAGGRGALVLYAPRSVAHELMMSVPPLLEVMSS